MADAPSNQPTKQTALIHILLILAATWLVYLNAVGNDFTNWDDPEVVIHNPNIRNLDGEHVLRILTPGEDGTSGIRGVYRPVWTLSYALDYLALRLNPPIYHAHSILLHSLNAVLVYLLAVAVGLAPLPSLLAALLFAIHPIHVEAVAWVSGRNEVLVTFFFLLAFLSAVFGANLANGFRAGPYVLSIVFLLLALLSKATAAVFPFLVLGTYLWFRTGDPRERKCSGPCLWRHLPYLILSAVLIFIELFVSRAGVVVRPEIGESRAITLLTMPKVILLYLASLLAPLDLSPRYDTAYVTGFMLGAFLTILGFALVVFVAVLIARRSREFGFCTFWFALTLLPASNVVLISSLRADRFLYLPSVGFCLAGGLLLHTALDERHRRSLISRIVVVLLCAGLVSYAGLSIRQNRVWRSSLTLWEHAVSRAPGDYMAQHNLGAAYFEADRLEEAQIAFEHSIALNPNYAKAHNNLGQILAKTNRLSEAEAEFIRAVEIDPDYGKAHLNLAHLYAMTGRPDDARREAERALAGDLAPQWRKMAEVLLQSLE